MINQNFPLVKPPNSKILECVGTQALVPNELILLIIYLFIDLIWYIVDIYSFFYKSTMGKRSKNFKPKKAPNKKVKEDWNNLSAASENPLFREYYELQLQLPV